MIFELTRALQPGHVRRSRSRRRAGAIRRRQRRRDLQVRPGDPLHGWRSDHCAGTVTAGVRYRIRPQGCRVEIDQLGTRRGNRRGSLGAGQPPGPERRRSEPEHHSAERAGAAAVHRVLPTRGHGHRSDRRGRRSAEPAGPTPAARATTTAAWSRTAASRARSCASPRIPPASTIQRR